MQAWVASSVLPRPLTSRVQDSRSPSKFEVARAMSVVSLCAGESLDHCLAARFAAPRAHPPATSQGGGLLHALERLAQG